MWLLFVGCVPVNSSDPEEVPFHAETPQIEALAVECDPTDGEWIFRIQTRGWTGGGRLYMARDAMTVEQHKIGSKEASASGQWDCLIEELDVSEDWTLAQSGSSTRWLARTALSSMAASRASLLVRVGVVCHLRVNYRFTRKLRAGAVCNLRVNCGSCFA